MCVLASCPNGWIEGVHGSCYNVSYINLTWLEAKSACEAVGSRLAVINSEAKQLALAPNVSHRAWIGLSMHQPGITEFLWVDGLRVSYSNWNCGEPSDRSETGVEIYPFHYGCQERGKWNYETQTSRRPYICEMNGKLVLMQLVTVVVRYDRTSMQSDELLASALFPIANNQCR